MKPPTTIAGCASLAACVLLLLAACSAFAQTAKRPDILIADFEMGTWGDWKAEGDAFSSGPAEGTLMTTSATLRHIACRPMWTRQKPC